MPTAEYMRKYRLEHPEYRENEKVLDAERYAHKYHNNEDFREKRKIYLNEYKKKTKEHKEDNKLINFVLLSF